jgi:hypothetical protein
MGKHFTDISFDLLDQVSTIHPLANQIKDVAFCGIKRDLRYAVSNSPEKLLQMGTCNFRWWFSGSFAKIGLI